MGKQNANNVPVSFAAKAYGKDPSWVRAGLITGYLPIGMATRNGKQVTSIDEMDSKYGRINYYISPKLLYEETGVRWTELDLEDTLSYRQKELLYFCRQYPYWKEQYSQLSSGEQQRPKELIFQKSPGGKTDVTFSRVTSILYYREKIELVDKSFAESRADRMIFDYVTSGSSKLPIEGRFMDQLMRFFYILDRNRE